ncbi:hypothetical protein KI387_030902, partial [Taxus chinensis]
ERGCGVSLKDFWTPFEACEGFNKIRTRDERGLARMASGLSIEKNDEGWAMASSRKELNKPRGGASSNAYVHERLGLGHLKGKAGYDNVEGQKPTQWGDSPSGEDLKPGRWGDSPYVVQNHGYKQPGWREAGKIQQKNGNPTTTTISWNGGGRGLGANNNQQRQSQLRPLTWGSSAVDAPARTAYVPPPLANGWKWDSSSSGKSTSWSSVVAPPAAKGEGSGANGNGENSGSGAKVLSQLLPFEISGELPQGNAGDQSSEAESEIEHLDSEEDCVSSDGFDSDDDDISHETMKKNKWFKSFFEALDSLSVDQINEPERQWHCPACSGGVGAIDWYRGMQPVLTHAKTITSKRVKLHRKLFEVLEEELRRRGAYAISEEMFGKWKGLQETIIDREIVWPPIVIIQNTILDQDENEQWVGMGNKELLDYFRGYKAMKARHAYGPKGHRGMSVLIFEETAMGYLEAERLHRHFLREGRGKEDWERRKVLFHPGGQRCTIWLPSQRTRRWTFLTDTLKVCIVSPFRISHVLQRGKARLKYEMKSYHKMVVEKMKQMDEDNQKLIYFKSKVAKEQEHSKTLEETVTVVSSKLRMRDSEIKIIRHRATDQHEESKKEMDFLEHSYRQQIDQLNEDIAQRE